MKCEACSTDKVIVYHNGADCPAEERKPCYSCGRIYGHLDSCKVPKAHAALDKFIKRYGVDSILAIFESYTEAYPAYADPWRSS